MISSTLAGFSKKPLLMTQTFSGISILLRFPRYFNVNPAEHDPAARLFLHPRRLQEHLLAQIFQCVGKCDVAQAGAEGKRIGADGAQSVRKFCCTQTGAAAKGIGADVRQGVSKCHRFQTAAPVERLLANSCHRIRQFNLQQTGAVLKGVVADEAHIFPNGN